MSLINEALKRTRDAAYRPANVPPVIDVPKYIVPEARPENESILKTYAGFIIAGVVLAIVVAGYATGFVKTNQQPAAPARWEEPVIAGVVEKAKAEQKEALDPLATPTQPATVAAAPASPSGPTVTQPEPVAPPEPPKLTLQGIAIDGKSREALINNVTVHIGEDIEGAKVTGIEPTRVTLDFGGHEIVLRVR